MKKDRSERKAEFKAAVIKQIKSLIFPVILVAIIGIGIFVVLTHKDAVVEEKIIRPNGYEGDGTAIVLENDKIKFVMDPSTTQFEVIVKSTGKVWKSNPSDVDTDTVALPTEKNNLQSTLLMTYSQTTGLETSYNNYEYSISNSIYEIEATDEYVKVNYSLGDIEREYIIPPVCTADNFDKWLGLMSKEGVNLTKQYYKKYDINNLGKKDDKEALLESYPVMADSIIYVLRDNASASVKIKMEEFFEEIGYTMEDYAADKALNFAESTSDKPVFNMDMIYTLEGDSLKVELPLSSLEFANDKPIYNITILPYFGCGNKTDEGYLFVPEGGGALINFNNGKAAQPSYYANVYGWDMCLTRDAVVHNTRAYYNAFGISNGNDSFICTMEEGAPYAAIQADISGRLNSYNYVNAKYSIKVRERYNVGEIANSAIYVYLNELPDETLTQVYTFIDSPDYVDMAKAYGEYMQSKYGNLEMNNDASTPVAIEIVGAVDKVKQILGVPVSRPFALTTYDEALEIVQTLNSDGVDNMSVKMTGWANGGVKQKILEKVKPIRALGSTKDLKNMISQSKELGVDVYLNGITQYEYNSNIFDGFFSFTDAAKFISKERAELHIYSAITYSRRDGTDPYYLLHADLALEMAENLVKKADSLGAYVSFEDTGMDLSSDYYKKDYTSRQEALYNQQAQLKSFSEAGQKIMINMGNDYAIAYADMVTNMDLKGSEYTIIDAFVPFYQIALHGYVNYTGDSLNIAGNTTDELLASAEYGAGLAFTFMNESAFSLQKTLYTEYYGADFDAWHEQMLSIYNRYNSELGHVFNQEIVDHKIIAENLTCTKYEDGTKVYVNYSYADLNADGVTVPARDYKVVK